MHGPQLKYQSLYRHASKNCKKGSKKTNPVIKWGNDNHEWSLDWLTQTKIWYLTVWKYDNRIKVFILILGELRRRLTIGQGRYRSLQLYHLLLESRNDRFFLMSICLQSGDECRPTDMYSDIRCTRWQCTSVLASQFVEKILCRCFWAVCVQE